MNREHFTKLFGIPKQCKRDGSYKSLDRFFKTEIITRKNLDAMFQHLSKTEKIRPNTRYGVMKAYLGYKMTMENKLFIAGRAGWWGDSPTGESAWTNDVMRSILYPKMTKGEVWEHLFREVHDIRQKAFEKKNVLEAAIMRHRAELVRMENDLHELIEEHDF